MADLTTIEAFGTYVKVTGQLEVLPSDRLSDTVNRFGAYLTLRNALTEPITSGYPVLSRSEPKTMVRKTAIELVCPGDHSDTTGNQFLWRQKSAHTVAITTQGFSLVGEVHLDPRVSLEDHLERYPGDFVPMTNISALWVAAASSETMSVQRPFGLLNPQRVVAFSWQS